MKKTVYCYYHRIDLDGHCSAAIVREWVKANGYNFVGIEIDHSDGNKPFEKFPGRKGVDIGVMVDFCAPTFEMMYALNNHFSQFIWVDHHASSIEMMKGPSAVQLDGLRRIGDAACELCLEFFFPDTQNDIVELLGRYDVWDNKNKKWDWEEQIMPFQLYMLMEMGLTLEEDDINWEFIFKRKNSLKTFKITAIDIGKHLYQYDMYLKEEDQQFAYRTRWNEIPCVCINSSLRGSQTLESICAKNEMMITWRFDGKQWAVGLYSHKGTYIDCSLIAKKYNGGGHKHAAGFRLPITQNPVDFFGIENVTNFENNQVFSA